MHLYQRLIIKFIISNNFDPFFPSDLKKHFDDKGIDLAKVQEVINSLVKASLLRYNADGQLLLHSRLVKRTCTASDLIMYL